MNTMRYCLIGAALLACGAAFAQPPMASAETDFAAPALNRSSPVREAAVKALAAMADQLKSEAGTLPQGFPFDVQDVAELQQARIGYGFQVYDADPHDLSSGASLEASARPTGVWRFTVTRNERPIGLMTMAEGVQGWESVSIGGANLAKEVDAVVDAQSLRAGAQLRYVRVPQATADFIQVKIGAGSARFSPLQAARESLRVAASRKAAPSDGLLADSELQASLREAVARNLTN